MTVTARPPTAADSQLQAVPRVTVVLPVFNAVATLPRAIDSLRNQSFRDFEILAIDDGSTDGSGTWLEAQAREEPRLRVVRGEHLGIAAALNAGLAAARGGIIARMDADDACAPERFGEQVAWLDAHPAVGLVASLVEFAGDTRAAAGYAAHVDWMNSVITAEDIRTSRFIESPFAHPSVMFRRELAERWGGYRNGGFPEDYELWLRWLDQGVRMEKVPKALFTWHDSPGRLSRTDPRYAPAEFFRLKATHLARWLRTEVDPARKIHVWGAGRLTRRRVDALISEGISVAGYIDIDRAKQGRHREGRLVIDPGGIPPVEKTFVLGYVAKRGARESQRAHLAARGFVEGRDFLFAA